MVPSEEKSSVKAPRASSVQACASRKFRRAYFISFAHTERRKAKAPSDFSRCAFAQLLKKAHEEVFHATAQEGELDSDEHNHLQKVVVFRELHADGAPHMSVSG